MSKGKNQYVIPRKDGGWAVKGEGNSKATVCTKTQKEAIAQARQIAINQHAELTIVGQNHRIRAKNSYGNDPYPPKG